MPKEKFPIHNNDIVKSNISRLDDSSIQEIANSNLDIAITGSYKYFNDAIDTVKKLETINDGERQTRIKKIENYEKWFKELIISVKDMLNGLPNEQMKELKEAMNKFQKLIEDLKK